MTPDSAVRIVLVYPELLGTYGDGGNAMVLAARAQWRGLRAETVPVRAGEPVPDGGDIYLLGGGEDEPQALAAAGLRTGELSRAVTGGAALLAVCAGLQVIGTSFPGTDGRLHDGVGLVELSTAPGTPRVVGDLVVSPRRELGLPVLYGYENHGGRTTLGPGLQPLGEVRRGLGNGAGRAWDGVLAGPGAGWVVGTYLHGPVLAQNPALADRLLAHVVGDLPALPVDLPAARAAEAATAALRAARARQTGVA